MYLDSEIFRLKSMKLHNFMGINGELFIDFDDVTEIIGDNGAGKSTLLDAICFVFCYTDAWGNGNTKVNFSTAGALGTETFVEIEAKLDNVPTVLKRNFSVTATGKQVSTLWVNHLEQKSTEWKEKYDKDVFLSIINPKYFSMLPSKDAKKLLLKFAEMKDISKLDILSSLDADAMTFLMEETDEQDIDTVRDYYENNIQNLKNVVKENKAEIKKLKNIPEVEHPKDEYNIDGLLMTENAAWNYVVDKIKDSSSDDNFNKMKLFIEQKAQRASILERFKQYNDALSKIEELEADNEKIAKQIEDESDKVKYVDMYYQSMLEQLNLNSVDGISVAFKDKLDKEAFIVMYNNVPINECSFAEQVRAGIALSDFLMSSVEISYPIIIDNSECITSMPKLKGDYRQLISLTVEKGVALSRYVGRSDNYENLYTLKTMPRNRVKGRFKPRLLGTEFEISE